MVRQTERREISRGVCRFCQGEFAKNKITLHLKSCKARIAHKTEHNGQEQRLLHLLVEGKYRPEYWMHLEVPAVATLSDLDDFLRTIWLECCGHLSEFTINGVSYASFPDDGWIMSFSEQDLLEEEDDDDEEGEEEEEDEELPAMEEVVVEIAKRLSTEFHTDLKNVPVEQIEERLVQLFTENMPMGRSPAVLQPLRPVLGAIALSLQQGTLVQDLQEVMLDGDEEDEEDEEEGMDAELGSVVNVGEKFSYTYDFGSSSTLSLRVIGEREGVLPVMHDEGEEEDGEDEEEGEEDLEDGGEIVVMARNELPPLACHICGQPAAQVSSGSEYDSLAEGALCETHASASEYPDELLPVVNSPRTGICGYTGEEDEEDWDDEEWDDEEEDEE
ncbi:MAG TPA: hypothetical protein VGF67_12735 [Ktedonobacteraceae bacterium]|jgi:hypothetical protein